MKVTPVFYTGAIRDLDGTKLKKRNGEEICVRKVMFTIDNVTISGVLDRVVKAEIAEGSRPANWDNPFHPDYNVWRACIKMRNGIVYDGKSESFGFASVCKPGEFAPTSVLDEYKLKTRASHVRTFKHPRFVNMKDKQVTIKETTVGPKL